MKINLKSHLQNLSDLLLMAIFYYGLIIFLEKDVLQIWYWHLPIIIVLFPTIFLHISYSFQNYNDDFLITKKSIVDRNRNIEHDVNSIFKIVIYKHKNLGTRLIPIRNYKYCKVILKNGESFILTSLLKYNIDEFLKKNLNGVVFENHHKYFPSL